jgi:ferric iron reductase protein FhuF
VTGASPSLDAVEALVPFLTARRDQPEPGDLLAADLAAEPDLLAKAIDASGEVRGSEDPQVLASLWWQGYAYRSAGVPLAAWVVTGHAPDPAAEVGTGIGVTRGRPSSLVVGTGAGELDDLGVVVDRLFAGHLDLVAESLRARHPIGWRLVWGNAAASVASCLGAVAGAEGADPALGERIDEVTAALPHDIGALGTWTEPHTHYRRTTCCLWWKTTASKGALCEDCSLR